MPKVTLSKSEDRREDLLASAIHAFAAKGYLGTTIADVALVAGISPAYVSKLYPSKEQLFVAALDRCYELVLDTLVAGADAADDDSPAGILDAMGGAYASLIAERDYLMLQVHAQSAASIAPIARSIRTGLAAVTRAAKERSQATDSEVQRFIAYGQLCHLIVTTQVDESAGDWARIVTAGIRHPEKPPR